jgi:arylsulfatase A-like enzyme
MPVKKALREPYPVGAQKADYASQTPYASSPDCLKEINVMMILKLRPIRIAVLVLFALSGNALAASEKPNILVIWGDDIGQSNISAYTHGLVGYQTPNIDRIAAEGMMFTDGMVEHDMHVGQLLNKLDELGIADNTIVFYSTDNGPHMNTWPDAGWSPFRGEKNTNWEGGWRVPAMVRWPGKIKANSVSNEVMHHMDWLPTLVAAAGNPNIKEELKKGGVKAIDREYRVHLDGYNFLPYLTGQEKAGPREEVFYFSDTGDLTALRHGDWKAIFLEQKAEATLRAWIEPWTPLRVPLIFNLRRDPYERAYATSNTYYDWLIDHIFFLVPAQAYVGQFLATFEEFPPRQKAASFSITR